MILELSEGILSQLFPATCVLCGARGHSGLDLCAGCLADLPHNRRCCARCAIPMAADQPAGAPCGACSHRPPPYAAAHSAFLYQDPIPALVAGAKFRGRLNLARLLGICLARSLIEVGAEMPEMIVPVPLHPGRMRERGYNQALEVARATGRELGIPVDARYCVRTRSITPQEGLEKAERRRNVRGAFAVRGELAARHVALLDDVVTTGSTAAEVTKVLLKAGIDRVDLWAVARTP
jgi:ComF family protein